VEQSTARIPESDCLQMPKLVANYDGNTQLATFAGGCFLVCRSTFEGIDGVVSVVSGYSGGKKKPTYVKWPVEKLPSRILSKSHFDPEYQLF